MKKQFHHSPVLRQQGFTLIELMVTVVITIILLTSAVPSFLDLIIKDRTITSANTLVTALNLARSESIKRGVQVSLKRKSATSKEWESGWDVFTDIDADGTLDDDSDTNLCESGEDCLLRTYGSLPTGYTLRSGGNYANWIAYLPSGLSRGSSGLANDTFRLCDADADTAKSRAISVNASGRPRTATGTASCP